MNACKPTSNTRGVTIKSKCECQFMNLSSHVKLLSGIDCMVCKSDQGT